MLMKNEQPYNYSCSFCLLSKEEFHFFWASLCGIKHIYILCNGLCGLPWGLSGEESTCQRVRCGSDPWSRKIPWGRKRHSSILAWEIPLQYSCLGNPTPVFLPGKSHSGILAWEIPRTEDPGGLQSMRSRRAGRDLATKQQPWPMWEKNKQVDKCGYMWIYKGSLCCNLKLT